MFLCANKDLSVNVQESPSEAWVDSDLLYALNTIWHAKDLLKEVTIIFITPIIVCLQVKQQGGDTALPINRNLD